MEAEDRHEIREMKMYVDDKRRQVRVYSQVFGKNLEKEKYTGYAMVRKMMVMPGGQAMARDIPVEFPFPDGVGLKAAFDTFEETLKKFLNEQEAKEKVEMQARADASRVVPATAMPNGLRIVNPGR